MRVAHNKLPVIVVECRICEKLKGVWPARALTFRYCSYACSYEAKRRVRGVEHKLYKGPAIQACLWCGDEFQTKPAKVLMGEGKYCSRRCHGSARAATNGYRSSIEFTTERWLSDRQIEFEPQKQMGPWLADFYLPSQNTVIECDGDYWHAIPKVRRRDRQKDGWMRHNGISIIRLSETEIKAGDFSKLSAL